MKIGYARTSTQNQNLAGQLQALKEYGCDRIVTEQKSGKNTKDRPVFTKLIAELNPGDILIVTKLDRMARSTRDALKIVEELEKNGVELVVLNMGGSKLDTTEPIGKLLLIMLSGIAEFELSLSKERQREGIAEAKKAGKYRGKPVKYGENNPKLLHALELFRQRHNNGLTVKEIAHITGISRTTIYNNIKGS